ncbi:hypothetical protein EPIR_2476 [Erwinia piriflorinigrans CFBP 5888]|uniref:Uncharacterized protein n=1 Tax=Erwinia piriflorinigrans CFBP 5888 TaxID=1161919 RepID=V5Z9B7_9GAMM|nr:hypothetical protein EPIR_2476 [Erwinia piriflorinigrans CFBP 5888]
MSPPAQAGGAVSGTTFYLANRVFVAEIGNSVT